jgi:predicted nucleic acid-binding protein
VIYLDTSYLVRLYFEEPGFPVVRELVATDQIACAVHGQAEILSAFHRKFREGVITPKAYQARLAQFAADREAGAFHWLPAGPEVLERISTVFAGLPRSVYLRGADGLHLATAAANAFKAVYSNDSHLLAAAPHFKLKGLNPIAA